MNRKLSILCSTIFTVVILTSGCSNSLKNENINLTKEVSYVKEKNNVLEKSIVELKEETKSLNDKLKELDAKNILISEKVSKNKNSVYPIYSADVNTYEKQVHFGTYIAENLSLRNKLEALSKTLSEVYFDKLPIEVLEIKEANGKKTAVINLKESEENQKIIDVLQFKGQSWARNYFQGSTGGNMTSICLIETFLQRDYQGEWIDGVKFLYNNKGISFDHVPSLGEVSYRD
jgi:FtsZ-binding cell division protein ZapB